MVEFDCCGVQRLKERLDEKVGYNLEWGITSQVIPQLGKLYPINKFYTHNIYQKPQLESMVHGVYRVSVCVRVV